MYRLYWNKDTGALAPHILLEEIGAEYELQLIDMDNDEQSSTEYLKINPRGQVPAMALADGTIITESAAISLHLVDQHPEAGLIPDIGSSDRARVYRWLFYASANLYEAVLRFYYTDTFTTDASQVDQIQDSARSFINHAWQLLENEIDEGPYLLGLNYSIVDPYLLMLTNWHEDPDALFEHCPKLKRLCATVRSRPAVEQVWPQHFE